MALTRRQVLKSALAISISACLPGCRFNESQHADVALDSAAEPLLEQQLQALSQFQQPSSDALQAWWQAADRIVAATAAVVIPQRRWNLVSLGVRPTLTEPCTEAQAVDAAESLHLARINRGALQQAIDELHTQGGGQLILPAGHYWCGALTLKSRVALVLEQGAYLQFHPATDLYLPLVFTRWEGMELMGYQPLLYAIDSQDIAVTGQGIIDGGGSNQHWWPWKGKWKHTPWQVDAKAEQKDGRTLLMTMVEQGVPVQDRVLPQNFLRPPLWQPYRCQRVEMSGLTLRNSPFWVLNPVLCQDVVVRSVNVNSHGPNSDGCDPESCKRVLIEHCNFDCGDDCIALKSGRNADGRRLNTPIEQVVIQHCQMQAGHGGVVIGSEISGGARYIFARDLTMSSPDLERGLRIKTNALRGGRIDTVALRDIDIGQVKDAIVIDYWYEEGNQGAFLPQTGPVWLHQVNVRHGEHAFQVRGFAQAPVRQLWLSQVAFTDAAPGVIEHVAELQMQQVTRAGQPWQLPIRLGAMTDAAPSSGP